jgi:hypothetical protein
MVSRGSAGPAFETRDEHACQRGQQQDSSVSCQTSLLQIAELDAPAASCMSGGYSYFKLLSGADSGAGRLLSPRGIL